jgi:hypothetical protein
MQRILLIGNSQMGVYDLPAMLEAMVASAPAGRPRLAFESVVLGGKGLRTHWELETAPGTPRARIAEGGWDQVVLQEIYNAEPPEFGEYAARFDDLIRSVGARTVLFATASITTYYRDDEAFRYPDGFRRLNEMQIAFAQPRGIPVAAAGLAWMRYLGENPAEEKLLDLYAPDRGHPGPKGTYLYACLLYAVLARQAPVGLIHAFPTIRDGIRIAPDEALRMQQAAWAQCRQSPASVSEERVAASNP